MNLFHAILYLYSHTHTHALFGSDARAQIGFILYSPLPGFVPWSDHDHGQMMIVTSLFVIHMIGVLAFMCLFGIVIHRCTCCHTPSTSSILDYDDISYHPVDDRDDVASEFLNPTSSSMEA